MMPRAVEEQLKELVELHFQISACPTQALRQLIISYELEHHKPFQQEITHRYSDIEYRWLYFNLKIMEETHAHKIPLYLAAAYKCKEIIHPFDSEYEQKIKDIKQLKILIEQQMALIFTQCLSDAQAHYLIQCAQNPNHLFSVQDILADAIRRYKLIVYREALLQFEIESLIARFAFLKQKEAAEQKNMLYGMMTINTGIAPELHFIKTMLDEPGVQRFKLEGTHRLYFSVDGFTDFSQDNLLMQVSDFFIIHGEDGIDSRVSDVSYSSIGNNIKSRSFNLYFNHKEQKTLMSHLSIISAEIEQFMSQIELPKIKFHPVETKDKKLITLRQTILTYQSFLETLEKEEQTVYKNRSNEALIARRQIVQTLNVLLNRTQTLTAEARQITIKLVTEIKLHQPTWSELAFIDKLFDILSFGIRAYCRYSTFKEPKPLNDLYDDINNDENKLH